MSVHGSLNVTCHSRCLCGVMIFFYNWMCNNTPSLRNSPECLRKTFVDYMCVCAPGNCGCGVNKILEYGLGRKAKWPFNSGLTTENTEH